MDFYSASGLALLWVCFFQSISIGWFFGAEKFSDCIAQMTGHKPSIFWTLCWKYFAPAVMLVSEKASFKPLKRKSWKTHFLLLTVGLRLLRTQLRTGDLRRRLRLPGLGRGPRRLLQPGIHDLGAGVRCVLLADYAGKPQRAAGGGVQAQYRPVADASAARGVGGVCPERQRVRRGLAAEE